MKADARTNVNYVTQPLQVAVFQSLTRLIGGGKNCYTALCLCTLALLCACSEDTPDTYPPDTLNTRTIADSTTATGQGPSVVEADTAWAGINEYDFDGRPVITIPDSVPVGDAGDAV